ncbi:MAG: hypothetical protein QG559_1318 [Campylobacterota bacterium]|nr:hypothetical protein [Campylobacterota bacterium]
MLNNTYQLYNLVDENQTRLYAALLVVLMVAYLFSFDVFYLYLLICDFLIRLYITPYISPIYLISTFLVKIIKPKQKFTDGDAKEFASHIGLIILFIALGANLLVQKEISFLLVFFLCIWKIVEAGKEFCFACKFYEMLKNKNIEVESL